MDNLIAWEDPPDDCRNAQWQRDPGRWLWLRPQRTLQTGVLPGQSMNGVFESSFLDIVSFMEKNYRVKPINKTAR